MKTHKTKAKAPTTKPADPKAPQFRVELESTRNELNSLIKHALPVLDHKTEIAYVRLTQAGNIDARNKLLRHNIRMIVDETMKFSWTDVQPCQLAAAAIFGFFHALELFDHTRGIRLYGYAIWWVRQRLRLEVGENMLIRTSSTHRQYTRKANKTLQIYQSKNPREHDVDWLVEHGELIQDAFRPAHAKVISLDSDVTSVDDDTPASMYDTLVGLPELHRFQPIPDSDVSSETLDTIIAKIEDKRIVTILRNELCDADHHLPLRVMGAKLGLSQERVRQLKTQGYKIMRFELKKLGLVPEWAAEG